MESVRSTIAATATRGGECGILTPLFIIPRFASSRYHGCGNGKQRKTWLVGTACNLLANCTGPRLRGVGARLTKLWLHTRLAFIPEYVAQHPKAPAIMRCDDRRPNQLRPLKVKRRFTHAAPGSVLIQAGRTTVLCAAAIEPGVPNWMAGQGRGWLTAEYSMLPGSTRPRKRRERGGNLDGRTTEIQRLIGRSLRAVVDLAAVGERTITIDPRGSG